MNDLKSQLLPGWSPLNIGLLVVLYFIWAPLAILMLLYIVFGAQFGLNLARPETFASLGSRISQAWKSDAPRSGTATRVGGTPEPRMPENDPNKVDPNTINRD